MATQDPKALAKVSTYMRSDMVKARFAEAIGDRNAGAYISSVMLAVANDDSGKLAQCTPESIYISALRAATLRLSVDPSTGQAYMVSFGAKATLIVGYKGLMDMAVRTGKYRYINVSPIYEGETVTPDRISGLITLASISGQKQSDNIIGWLAAFEMNPEKGQKSGYAHTLYMTVDEIHTHAGKYSRGYDYKNQKGEFTSLWHKSPREMERKTVLRLLIRKYGYMDPADVSNLEETEKDAVEEDRGPVYTAEFTEANDVKETNEAKAMAELGDGASPVSDTAWKGWIKLCGKAEKLGIPVPMEARENYTNQTLATIYANLEVAISDKK
jgi:recombination protein RecT